jgi:stage IV sporulation protein FB
MLIELLRPSRDHLPSTHDDFMLIGEPARTPYDLAFSLFGVPVRVHPGFWLIGLFLGGMSNPPMVVLIWISAVFLAILVHELGHAMAMRAYGYFPWIILYWMGGLTSRDPRVASRSRHSDTFEDIVISAAGPGAGFALAGLLAAIVFALNRGQQPLFASFGALMMPASMAYPLALFLYDVFYFCVVWGLINLLPIYPLDGGQIARDLFLRFRLHDGVRLSLMLSLVAAIGMTLFGGLYALLQKDIFIMILFGSFAYENYSALRALKNSERW